VRDQTSALLPAGALVVAPLLRASNVLHAEPRLLVMPDHPALGEWRSEFAGKLGTLEERPAGASDTDAGFAGALDIVSTPRFLELVERGPFAPVDSRAYLAARLLDLYVGDTDRHEDQWRWALVPVKEGGAEATGQKWMPIPRDRDFAFIKMDGLLPALLRSRFPRYVTFGDGYPAIVPLTWSASILDRRLLSDLGRPSWDTVVAVLQFTLADSLLDAAVLQLPREFTGRHPLALRQALGRRRDALPALADRFYRMLAAEPDVHATDAGDLADVNRLPDGRVELRIQRCGEGDIRGAGGGREGGAERSGAPQVSGGAGPCITTFQRIFEPRDTREVRLHLHGGDDRAVVRGRAPPGIIVRVTGGAGDDSLFDSSRVAGSRRATRFYDSRGDNTIEAGDEARVDRRPWFPPELGPTIDGRPRDWGAAWQWEPWLDAAPDAGVLLGVGRRYRRFGFRQHPYAWEMTARAGYTTAAGGVRAEITGDWRQSNSPRRTTLLAR